MAHPFTLYTHPMSRGRIARWMLEECGAAYDTVLLDYGTSMKAPAYLEVNRMGKVPALRHGSAVVTEGAAICAYLADQFPEKRLAPAPADPARGAYYRWLFFASGPMEAATTAKSLGLLAPPDKAIQAGYGRYEDVMDTLEAAVSQGPYLCADHFTAADLYLAAFLGWGMQFGSIEKRPAFVRYADPHLQRPASRRAVEIDDALAAQAPQA